MQHRVLEFIVAFAVLSGAYFWVGHHAVESYKQEQEVVQMRANEAQQKKYNVLAQDYEELKAKRQANAKVIIREVEKVIDNPVYNNECIDSTGLSIINQALSGGAPKYDSAVHAP